MTAEANEEGKVDWKSVLQVFVAVAGIAGIVLFGVLTLAYERFYGALGLDPSDIGLTYSATLAKATGLALWFGLYVVFFVVVAAFWRWWTKIHGSESGRVSGAWKRYPEAGIAALTIGILIITAIFLPMRAGGAADDVKRGDPVDSVAVGPLVLLSMSAQPARVERLDRSKSDSDSSTTPGAVVGPGANGSGIARIEATSGLLFLGKADGTIFLYDAKVQEVVQIPSSAVILRILDKRR